MNQSHSGWENIEWNFKLLSTILYEISFNVDNTTPPINKECLLVMVYVMIT